MNAKNANIRDAIALRPMVAADHAFVLDSFRRHILEDGIALESLNHADVRPHVEELARCLRSGIASCMSATLGTDADRIVGWAIARDGEIVFTYVRSAFRRWGIGSQLTTALVESVPMPLVYWTSHAERIRSECSYPLLWAWETCKRIQRKSPRRSKNEDQARSIHAV